MTAPRAREQAGPPSPPDRRPPRRGVSASGLRHRIAGGGARLSGRGAFRRTAAAFLVVLAAAVAFVPTAQGQTEVTLGSNLEQSGTGTVTVAAGTWLAVPLPAPERGQVTLTAVTLDIPTHGEGLTVAIHLNFRNANNNQVPVADALYALNPPSVRGTGLQTFTAPENAIIKRKTRYWVVLSVSASGETSEISHTDTANDDLSDPHLYIGGSWDVSTDGQTWTVFDDSYIRMRFSGYPPEVVGTPFTMTLEIPDLDPVEGAGGRLHSFVDVKLSQPVWIPYKDMRDNAFTTQGTATIVKAKRMPRSKTRRYYDGRRRTFSDHWRLEVRPDEDNSLQDPDDEDSFFEFSIKALPFICGDRGGMCTSDGGSPGNYPNTGALPPAGADLSVSIADATASEDDGVIVFTVSLSRAAAGTVEVDFETTTEGTATEGVDFRSGKSLLVLFPEETTYDISVGLFDDAVDDDGETVIVKLTGARLVQFDPVRRKEKRRKVTIADDEATGTINNSDPVPRGWLARFGRTVATHVTDAVGERLRAGSGASHVTVGGYRLPLGQPAADGAAPGQADSLASLLTGRAGGPGTDPGGGGPGWDAWPDAGRDPRLGQAPRGTFDLQRLLLGSSFRLNLGAAATGSAGPRLTAWGRVAGTTFDGRDGTLSLDGDVLTGTVGVDGAWDRLLAGLAVAHSRGDGAFTKPGIDARGRGGLESTLTSVHPYLRYAVTDRLAVWGLLGFGTGQMEMELDTGETRETDMDLVMGAFGGRGILLAAAESGGFQLATRTDAMLTRTTSDAVQTADGNMASGDAEAHRLRLVLEGSRGFAWAEGRRLTPTMEVGLRHDWGDAETGFGLELGGRVHYADPTLGLTIEAAVRGLLAHEDDDYQEWGASGSLRLAPGAGGRGLALTLAPTWGAASSGVNGLWSRQTTAGLAPQGNRAAPAGQLNAEVGYGFAPFGTGLLTPYAGTVLSDGAARTYRVGGRLQMRGGWATGLTLNLEGTRQDPAGQQPVNQGLRLQLTWGF